MIVDVVDQKNTKVGTAELPKHLFGARWNEAAVRSVLLAHRANARRPWAHAKDRSEVRGGGRKPWRQKGTGRARHGSIRSPLWRGGGKSHGPSSDRDYSVKVNKKTKRVALAAILSRKLRDGNVKIVEDFTLSAVKTNRFVEVLKSLSGSGAKEKKFSTLVIAEKNHRATLSRVAANVPTADVTGAHSVNSYDLARLKNLYIEKNAITEMAEHFAPEK